MVAAEGRPSSLPEERHFREIRRRLPEMEHFEAKTRRRRSPNLGITTLALDSLGNILGIEALGSSISPAEAALALFATRKILICTPIQFVPPIQFVFLYLHILQLSYPQTPFTNG